MTAAVAAAVFAALLADGAYYAIAAGLLGAAIVVAAAGAVLVGLRPSWPATAVAAALVCLGGWAVASTAWGGLPEVALRFLGLTASAAAAVLLGASLVGALRAGVVDGLALGIAGHAAMTLCVIAAGRFPGAWFVGRQLEGTVGYHNALGAAYAMGMPLAVWVASSGGRLRRFLGSAGAVVVLAGALLTQSRGTLLVVAVGLLVQLALSRSGRVTITALALLPVASALVLLLRDVDDALVTADFTDMLPESEPLARYAVAALGGAALTGLLLAAPPASFALPRRLRTVGMDIGVLVVVAALIVSAGVVASRAGDLVDRLSASPNSPSQTEGGATRLTSLSPTGRIEQWRLATRMTRERPLGGHGAGTFARRWAIERDNKDLYVLQPHSIQLEAASELGVIGTSALLVALGAVGWLVARGLRHDRRLGAAATASILAFLVVASVDWVFSFSLLLCAAMLLAGITGGPGHGRPLNVAFAAPALAALVVLAAPALGEWYLDRARSAEATSLAEAARLSDRARTFDRWNPRIVSQQARVLEGSGSHLRAAELYGLAADASQQPWLDLYRKARALRSAGRVAASENACRAASRSNPLEPALWRGVCDDVD